MSVIYRGNTVKSMSAGCQTCNCWSVHRDRRRRIWQKSPKVEAFCMHVTTWASALSPRENKMKWNAASNTVTVQCYFCFIFSRSYCYQYCMIGYWRNPVVRLSVFLWRCAFWLSVLVHRAKLYQRIPSRHVHISPFRHFCCRMYR